jgi:hypothetical protein
LNQSERRVKKNKKIYTSSPQVRGLSSGGFLKVINQEKL